MIIMNYVYLKRRIISIFTVNKININSLELKQLKYLFNKKYKLHLKKRMIKKLIYYFNFVLYFLNGFLKFFQIITFI